MSTKGSDAVASETLAALDLGTNSFHLVVARRVGDGFEILTREKESVRLGHGGGEMKHIEPDAMQRPLVRQFLAPGSFAGEILVVRRRKHCVLRRRGRHAEPEQ